MSVVHESWLLYPSWRSYSGIYRAGYWYTVGVLLFFLFSWSLSVCKVPHIQAHIVPHTILSTTLESWVFEALFQPESISSTDVKALFLISLSSGFRVALECHYWSWTQADNPLLFHHSQPFWSHFLLLHVFLDIWFSSCAFLPWIGV